MAHLRRGAQCRFFRLITRLGERGCTWKAALPNGAQKHIFLPMALEWTGGGLWKYGVAQRYGAQTHFFLPIPLPSHGGGGGALEVSFSSIVVWNADTFFSANSADNGGALSLGSSSTAAWSAPSFFFSNNAERSGGAVLCKHCSAAWTASSIFSANSAKSDGGAVYAIVGSLSWNADLKLVNNTARSGGAIFLEGGSTAEWTGETNFISNSAELSGGAAGSRVFSLKGYYTNTKVSDITIKGATSFVGNACGSSGGAIAFFGMLAVFLESDETVFSRNTAVFSGGAVYVAGTAIGPVFREVIFEGNFAAIGGGVRATGSGTAITMDEKNKQVLNPLTFEGCTFVDNFASGTGGAVDSASGQDVFDFSLFKGNKARVGGALRLGGKASVTNCSFVDNVSNLGEGPAVSNIGYISNVATSYFRDNAFNCESQTFLDFKVSTTFCLAS